ncbi:DUF805 domain-containing protein [Streptococcus dentapri]|uniref:DUF805 domain-containing protein n=1 Tax=Streptococcus dentapri TaxID=573564 RepID=A0ABV8D2V4_9STRE
MFRAYKNYWKQYVDFKGRTSRSGYWWVFLVNVLIAFLFNLIVGIIVVININSDDVGGILSLILLIYYIYRTRLEKYSAQISFLW